MIRRKPEGGLPLHVQDFLLGVRRSVQEIEQLEAAGVSYDGFFEFDEMPDAERVRLWREHGAALRREAKRRGIALSLTHGDDDDGPAAA